MPRPRLPSAVPSLGRLASYMVRMFASSENTQFAVVMIVVLLGMIATVLMEEWFSL
jgi:hypothetical protein